MPTEKQRQRRSPDLQQTVVLVRGELTRPRALTAQTLDFLLAHHEVTGDNVVGWLKEHLEDLESYELDLLLSPLFTPDFEMRVRCEESLGDGCLDTAEVAGLLRDLIEGDLRMTLLHEDSSLEASLPEVMIERFVRMLHLDAEVPDDALDEFGPLEPEVRCCLRDKAWARAPSRELLPDLLRAAQSIDGNFRDHVFFLTDFLRSHRPSGLDDCLSFLRNVEEAYETDLRKHESGSRSFFNDELKASYGGRRKVDDDVVATHKRVISTARALREALS